MTVPARHWRSLRQRAAPHTARGAGRAAAFASWFLSIACDRCGKARMVNGSHAPWRNRSLRDILKRMRHDGRGGLAATAELLTGLEAASSRPVRRIVLM